MTSNTILFSSDNWSETSRERNRHDSRDWYCQESIANLEGQLQFFKSHYANYVRSVYKNGRVYDVELLFSSKSINQLSIRIQYLKKFSEQRAKDLQVSVRTKLFWSKKTSNSRWKLQSERQLLSEKTREEGNLKRTFSQRHSAEENRKISRRIRKNDAQTEAFKKMRISFKN